MALIESKKGSTCHWPLLTAHTQTHAHSSLQSSSCYVRSNEIKMTWSAPVVMHLWERKQAPRRIFPRAASFLSLVSTISVCCYLISGSSDKSDSFMLMLSTCSLGASEHEEYVNQKAREHTFAQSRDPWWNGKVVIALQALHWHSVHFQALYVPPRTPGNHKVLLYPLLTLNYSNHMVCLIIRTISLLYMSSTCLSVCRAA